MGPGYVSSIDPAKRQLLLDIYGELSRQGTNLNQIARKMNAGTLSPQNGNTTLAALAKSLFAAHRALRHALTKGAVYDETC